MPDLADYERRLRRAGLPLFIEDYSAREDIFTRAVPLLGLVFAGELFGALNFEWSTIANVGAIVGGVAILLLALGTANRARGLRFWARPQEIGRLELAGFVLVPALLPAVFGGQWRSALVTAAVNLTLLGLIYLIVGAGLLSIVRWAFSRLASQLAQSLLLLARAIPLLLVFALVLFLTVEMWQVFARAPSGVLAALGGMFVVFGTTFLLGRLPREVERLEREAGGDGPPLRRAQRINVGLVMFVAQALQVLVVSVAVGGFFVAFGVLAIDPALQAEWIGPGTHVSSLLNVTVGGHAFHLTEPLLEVSGGIAAFSGLYYAIAVLTDSTYREEFLDELTEELRATFALRREYLVARAAG